MSESNIVIPEAAVEVLSGGLWSPAKPLRDTSWWHQWRRERACGEHDWHPEPDSMGLEWFCSRCSKEVEGVLK